MSETENIAAQAAQFVTEMNAANAAVTREAGQIQAGMIEGAISGDYSRFDAAIDRYFDSFIPDSEGEGTAEAEGDSAEPVGSDGVAGDPGGSIGGE